MVTEGKRTKVKLYGRIREILESARINVVHTVNTAQVMANWLIGREIVEEEQNGRHRVGYGTKLLAELSERLGRDYGRGYSVDNLDAFRQFYLNYPQLISETASRKSIAGNTAPEWQPGSLHPNLSWSHYRSLIARKPSSCKSLL